MTTGPTNLPDMTSLVACGRLQNAVKYCTQVMCKTGPVIKSQIFRPLFNPNQPNVARTSVPTRDMTSQLLPIGIYQSKKTAENDGFGSNFSGASSCLPHQLVGIVFKIAQSFCREQAENFQWGAYFVHLTGWKVGPWLTLGRLCTLHEYLWAIWYFSSKSKDNC